MSSEENKALIRRYVQVIDDNDSSDWSILDEFISEDVVVHNPLLPGLTPDLEGIKQAAEVFRQATPGRHEIPLQVAEGDLVVSVIVGRGVHAGELLGIPATGNEVETEGIAVTESPTGGSSSTGRSATSHACFSKWARSPHRPAFKGFKSLT